MKILTSSQIYEVDRATIQNTPISSLDLMERAASKCFEWVIKYLSDNRPKIHIFCGTGNNGGDGLVLSRLLIQEGYEVCTYIIGDPKKKSSDNRSNYERLKKLDQIPIIFTALNDFPEIKSADLVIDAIFGLGLSRPPEGMAKINIDRINQSKAKIISIDLPSGLFSEKSVLEKDNVIMADITLSFQQPKIAFFLPENENYCGKWYILDIGLDKPKIDSFKSGFIFVNKEYLESFLKKRKKYSHKGSFGHSLIIGGSFGKIGAVILASRAAIRAGSGLVSSYIPKCGYDILQASIPEVMVEVDGENQLEFFNYKTKPNAIGIGIGMGTSEKTSKGFGNFLKENTKPLVVDADGLNILSKHKMLLKLLPDDTILTPHPKEFERLVGAWTNDYDKLQKLKELSLDTNSVVVLKGAHTAIACNGIVFFNSTGNSALATAGSGDVLTGIIVGLRSQDYGALDSAILGVYLHGLTADIGVSLNESVESFIASDIITHLGRAFKKIDFLV